MLRILSLGITALALLNATSAIQAEVITFDATVKFVDTKSRTLTVERKGKTRDLDVSRKAKITIDGETSELGDLGKGQTVSLSYHDDLEIVLKIETVENNNPVKQRARPELVELLEINGDGNPQYPWPSPDGLTLYWDRAVPQGTSIWTASRKDTSSVFENKRRLFKGRHPTVTADGLYMVFLNDEVLYSAKRRSMKDNFSRPTVISELRSVHTPKCPCLSPDGLKLYYSRDLSGPSNALMVAERASLKKRWGKPSTLSNQKIAPDGKLGWPFVADDELTVLCTYKDSGGIQQLMTCSRKTIDSSFENHEFVRLPEVGILSGRSPRYVPSTQEMFFMRIINGKAGFWVVKNLSLSGFDN